MSIHPTRTSRARVHIDSCTSSLCSHRTTHRPHCSTPRTMNRFSSVGGLTFSSSTLYSSKRSTRKRSLLIYSCAWPGRTLCCNSFRTLGRVIRGNAMRLNRVCIARTYRLPAYRPFCVVSNKLHLARRGCHTRGGIEWKSYPLLISARF